MSLSVSRKRELRSFSDMRRSPVGVTCRPDNPGSWALVPNSAQQGLKSKLEDTAATCSLEQSAPPKVLPSLDGETPWHARQRRSAGTRRVRGATSRTRCAGTRKERQRAGEAGKAAG